MPALAVVHTDTRINSEQKEEFWFNECHILQSPNKYNSIDLIKNDIVTIDLRNVDKNGAARNHGTAFRIDEKFINLCFAEKEKSVRHPPHI